MKSTISNIQLTQINVLRALGFTLVQSNDTDFNDGFQLSFWDHVEPSRIMKALDTREDYLATPPSYVWFTSAEAQYVRALSFLGSHDAALVENLSAVSCARIRHLIPLLSDLVAEMHKDAPDVLAKRKNIMVSMTNSNGELLAADGSQKEARHGNA